MKRLKKVLLTLTIAWAGVYMIPSADCVEAKGVTISTDKSNTAKSKAEDIYIPIEDEYGEFTID